MMMEDVTVNLPVPLVDWYRRIAIKYHEKSLEDAIEYALVDNLQAILNTPDEVYDLFLEEIFKGGIEEVLKKHNFNFDILKQLEEEKPKTFKWKEEHVPENSRET